jgi:hypothetical protein
VLITRVDTRAQTGGTQQHRRGRKAARSMRKAARQGLRESRKQKDMPSATTFELGKDESGVCLLLS